MTVNTPPVLLVLPVLELSGAERIVASLAERLLPLGWRTSVICLEDERTALGRQLTAAGIPLTGLRISRRRSLASALALARALPAERPLIVHAHLFHANLAARLAKARLNQTERDGVHVLTTVHVAERRWRPWQFYLDRSTARYADREVCVSRAVAAFQRRQTGLPEKFFRVIENGIDLSRFLEGGTRKSERGSDKRCRVCSIGRLDAQKDFVTLLRAWKIVEGTMAGAVAGRPGSGGAELVIAGRGPEGPALEALARQLDLRHVRFAGFVDDIPALLQGCTVYVQSSAWEGFGLAVAEAMASGLPVVVTDADSLPELVTHGRTGLVVPRGDPAALAAAITRLLQSPTEAEALGAAARAEAVKRFPVTRMVQEYAQLYQEICGASP